MNLMQPDKQTPTSLTLGLNRWATLGCGLLLAAAHSPLHAQGPGGPAQTPTVTTVTLARQQVVLTSELPGRTAPYTMAEIRPQVSGLIQKRLFTEGADVQAGQELYQIDAAPFQAAYDSAKAALGRSEANRPAIESRVKRYQAALADKAVSQQDFDDASAALRQVDADIQYFKAAVETARINLAYARIVSPISGRIGRSSVTDGAIVTAYQPVPLATIQQLNPIYVDVPQSTADLLRLQRRLQEGRINAAGTNGNQVRLILPDGSEYEPDGVLQFRDVSVDPTTATVTLRAVFPNPKGQLLPGMFVRALVKEGVNDQAILVPQQAVARDPKGVPVALVVNAAGVVEQKKLTVERAVRDQWLVTSGVEPGDRVIVEGSQKVRVGMPVNAVPLGADPKAAPDGAAKPAAPAAPAAKTN